jgi:PAS domain S-box-containing protein
MADLNENFNSIVKSTDYLSFAMGKNNIRDFTVNEGIFKSIYQTYVKSISVYNQNGNVICSTGNDIKQLDKDEISKVQNDNNNKFFIKDNEMPGMISAAAREFIIYVPLKGMNLLNTPGRNNFIVAYRIDAPEFFRLNIIKRNAQIKKFGLWVIDREGYVLFQSDHPGMETRNINRITDKCLGCHSENSNFQEILNKETGHLKYSMKDSGWKNASFSTLELNNEKWKIVVTTPSEEVTKYIVKAANDSLILLILMIVILSLVTYYVIIFFRKNLRAKEDLRHLTENNKLLNKILETEGKYRDLFENNPIPMWVYSLKTLKFLMVNDAAVEYYGYTREEFFSMTLKDIRPREDISKLEENLAQPEKKIEISNSWRHRKKDGTIINVDIISHTLPESNGKHLRLVMAKDITETKTAEEKIKLLAYALESINECITITDLNHNLTFVNSAFCKVYGYDFDEVIGKHIGFVLIHKDVENAELKILNSTINGEWKGELKNKRKNGEEFFVSLSTSPIRDEKGEIIGLLGVTTDITERKQTEDVIRESEERYRTFINSTTDMVFLKDEQFRHLVANIPLADFYGKSPEEMLGLTDYDLMPEEAAKQCRDTDLITLNSNTITISEESIGNRIFETTKFPVALRNNKMGIGGFIRDTTSRRLDEKEIQMLAHSVASINECVSITDKNDNIIFVNEAFLTTYGYTKEELIGSNINILRPKDVTLEIGNKILSQTIDGGWKGEIINQRKDGTVFHIYLSSSVVKDNQGNPIALIGVATDITESKKAQQELIAAKEEAEEMNRLKTNFLTNMSHEVRTPMIGMLGFSEILKGELTDPEQKEMAEEIYTSGQRLMQTLNLVLNLSRIETNKMELKIKELNLKDVITNSIKIFEPVARKKNLYLNTIFKYNNIFCNLDEFLLVGIMNNLVINAIKFTKSGGITIETELKNVRNKTWAVINVIDTGIGIPEEYQHLIFEEFRQVSEGIGRSYEGTGLGLTITKKTVEIMNGTISVTSAPGKGSVFSVSFPAIVKDDGITNKSVIINDIYQIMGKSKKTSLPKILLVENDGTSANITKTALKGMCDIDLAEDGETAVEFAKNKKYSLILMDIGLGLGINGIEASKQIRNIPGFEKTPIVALTAFAMEGDKENFLTHGMDYYLSKPFRIKELKDLIIEILN